MTEKQETRMESLQERLGAEILCAFKARWPGSNNAWEDREDFCHRIAEGVFASGIFTAAFPPEVDREKAEELMELIEDYGQAQYDCAANYSTPSKVSGERVAEAKRYVEEFLASNIFTEPVEVTGDMLWDVFLVEFEAEDAQPEWVEERATRLNAAMRAKREGQIGAAVCEEHKPNCPTEEEMRRDDDAFTAEERVREIAEELMKSSPYEANPYNWNECYHRMKEVAAARIAALEAKQ